jgi:hypothetical protein
VNDLHIGVPLVERDARIEIGHGKCHVCKSVVDAHNREH